jgi:hypothetical protein
MSSDAARAMYPALARAEDQRRQVEKPREPSGKPAWAETNAALWGDIRPVYTDYSKVPGLRRVKR